MIDFKDFLLMTESQTKLVKDLVEEFGDSLVFNGKPFQFTPDNLKAIYQILNKHMFESKLNGCPIYYWTFDQIDKHLKKFGSKKELKNTFPAMHFILELHKDPRVVQHPKDFKFGNEIIFINSSFVPKSSLEGIVASICHEMIHSYDVDYGQYREFFHYELLTGEKMNYHRTPTFKTKMKEGNEMGIHIVEELKKDEMYAEFDQKAYEQLLATITEDDKQPHYSEEDLARGYVQIGNSHTHVIGKHTCIVNI